MMHTNLEHLDKTDLSNLLRRYYAGESESILMDQFKVSSRFGLEFLFPTQPTSVFCRLCGQPMQRAWLNRNYLLNQRLYCKSCKHKEDYHSDNPGCLESYSENQSIRNEKRMKKAIDFCSNKWNYSPVDISPDELPAREAATLMSLVRGCYFFDDRQLNPIALSISRFAPNHGGYLEDLITNLIELGIISPSPESWPEEFIEDQAADIGRFFRQVRWTLRISNAKQFVQQMERMFLFRTFPAQWRLDAPRLSFELASIECQEFFVYISKLHRFGTPSPALLESLITDLLEHHSAAECHAIILTGSRDALIYRKTNKDSSIDAATYMVIACWNYADTARKNNEEITGLTRPDALDRSQISFAIHDLIYGNREQDAFYSHIRT